VVSMKYAHAVKIGKIVNLRLRRFVSLANIPQPANWLVDTSDPLAADWAVKHVFRDVASSLTSDDLPPIVAMEETV
jgi:hypothetical protein